MFILFTFQLAHKMILVLIFGCIAYRPSWVGSSALALREDSLPGMFLSQDNLVSIIWWEKDVLSPPVQRNATATTFF